jgi:FKBP-type peptidyl-prolyl cis-trans isomerase
MKKIFLLFLMISVALFACKKETQLEEDLDDIKSFLKARNINAEKSDNIYYEVVSEGRGEQCEAGDTVAFKYKLYILNKPDSLISSSTEKALTYLLPSIIPNVTETSDVYTAGFQIGITKMKEGGISRFYVPSSYGFGNTKVGGEEYANLIYEVELCEIKHYDTRH